VRGRGRGGQETISLSAGPGLAGDFRAFGKERERRLLVLSRPASSLAPGLARDFRAFGSTDWIRSGWIGLDWSGVDKIRLGEIGRGFPRRHVEGV
jgi:hypothetical protein